MKPKLNIRILSLFLGLFLLIGSVKGQKYAIKFDTLAPEGSTWMNVMRKLDRELRQQTGGEVGFRIYPGGILGDERDVLRKIRIGQLHSAGFTGVGLGDIVPEVRIFDTPFLLKTSEEVDFVYQKFNDYFAESFSKNNYELLGWAEVGLIYVFTKKPVSNLEDLRKIRMWVWQGDPVAEASFKAFGLKSVPLSVIDVMTALQTNMVDGVYASPLAAIALQWFTKVKYMMAIPIANSGGAVLISKKMFRKLPENHQITLKKLTRASLAGLTQLSRQQNKDAVETLKKNGIVVIPTPVASILQTYYKLGVSVRRELVGKFYTQDILDRVESALKAFRENPGDF